MSQFISLSPFDITLASVFVLLAGGLSLYLRLGVEKKLFIAAFRTIVQLSLVGFVLEAIFSFKSPILVISLLFFMALVAGREAAARSRKRYAYMFFDTTLSMSLSAFIVGVIVTQIILGVKPWYHPQYVIPLVGMILGNSLNGVALALDTFIDYLLRQKKEIELFLVYGANRQEAMNRAFRAAVTKGLVPIINAMSVAGIVSLPGMMTGQILAGAPPFQAVAYQILVMFMLAGAYAIGAICVVWLAGRRLFSSEPRFKKEILKN